MIITPATAIPTIDADDRAALSTNEMTSSSPENSKIRY
jgi:hypothetical protein